MIKTITFTLLLFLLAGCATSGSTGLSSLSREVDLTPMRGQPEAQQLQDDRECVAWTRATKGKDEPLPNAELRYAVCAISRGYRADMDYLPIASPSERALDVVVAEMRECRAAPINKGAAVGG